jgi:hypothetical protein
MAPLLPHSVLTRRASRCHSGCRAQDHGLRKLEAGQRHLLPQIHPGAGGPPSPLLRCLPSTPPAMQACSLAAPTAKGHSRRLEVPPGSPTRRLLPAQLCSHNERRLGIFLHSGDPHQGLRTSSRSVSFSFLAFAQSPAQQHGGGRCRCCCAHCWPLGSACVCWPPGWSCCETAAGWCRRWGWGRRGRGRGHAAAALHNGHGAAAGPGFQRGLGPGGAAVQLGGAARAALHTGRGAADNSGRADAAQAALLMSGKCWGGGGGSVGLVLGDSSWH